MIKDNNWEPCSEISELSPGDRFRFAQNPFKHHPVQRENLTFKYDPSQAGDCDDDV